LAAHGLPLPLQADWPRQSDASRPVLKPGKRSATPPRGRSSDASGFRSPAEPCLRLRSTRAASVRTARSHLRERRASWVSDVGQEVRRSLNPPSMVPKNAVEET
jgi:hypothetical protein